MSKALLWFRDDLRLADHPALQSCLDDGHEPIPVYIHAPDEEGAWAPGPASNAWRHRSLHSLDATLAARGSRLVVRQGRSLDILRALVAETGADAVYWNRRYMPATQVVDAQVKAALTDDGVVAKSCNGALLFEPWDLATKQDGPYKVFTPFWRTALSRWNPPVCIDAPESLPAVPVRVGSDGVDALGFRPVHPAWDAGFWETRDPGEGGAAETLEIFIDGALRGYREGRDRPDQVGTSRLSPHLHFGEIAPWRVVAALEAERTAGNSVDMDAYIRQLGWREFAWHLLHHFPETTDQNLNPRFAAFPWAPVDAGMLEAWQRGRTGVPIVDAGMRELWHTGTMHNRVRMLVASYLTKHMRVHWVHGARWFWDTLVDADLANNSLGWQWVAGTGADAAPYFRVFNPVTQAQKFDPEGAYIARWVPELAHLPLPLRFAPWTDPSAAARIGKGYPLRPIVDLAAGRDGALLAYRRSRG